MRIVGTRAFNLVQKIDVKIVGTASVLRWFDPSCSSLVSDLVSLRGLDTCHLLFPHIYQFSKQTLKID